MADLGKNVSDQQTVKAGIPSIGVGSSDISVEDILPGVDPTVKEETKAAESSNVPVPTLARFMNNVKVNTKGEPRQLYAEEVDPKLRDAVESSDMISSSFMEIHKDTPRARAEKGALLGGAAGLGISGPVGAIMGAGIGALAGRAAGVIKSGEHEDELNKTKIRNTLSGLGMFSGDSVTFKDGKTISLPADPDFKIPNMNPLVGNKDRTIYDVDKTNPFAHRAMGVAKPLAYMVAKGINKLSDNKDPRHTTALSNTIGLIANALQTDAKDIKEVYTRAGELAEKFGFSEGSMRGFFDTIRNDVDGAEAIQLKKGLDIIYGRSS